MATFDGTSGADTLLGGADADLLTGQAGDDLLEGFGGNDTIDGGAGTDTVSYAHSNSPVTVTFTFTSGQAVSSTEGTDKLLGIERVVGSVFGDRITGWRDLAEGFLGGAGDDTLTGQSFDSLFGEAGDDRLISDLGSVTQMLGGDGADTISGSARSVISGGTGDDVIGGAVSGGVVRGDEGNDTLTASTATALDGGIGDDWLRGSNDITLNGSDMLFGGDGDDIVDGAGGPDTIYSGSGADLIVVGQGASRDGVQAQSDSIMDWSAADRLAFARGALIGGAYEEATAADIVAARTFANHEIEYGLANLVAVQVGGDVIVYADSANNDGFAEDSVRIVGRTLADLDSWQFLALPTRSGTAGQGGVVGIATGNMDTFHLGSLTGEAIISATDTGLHLSGRTDVVLFGRGLTYDANQQLTGGTVDRIVFTSFSNPAGFATDIKTPGLSAAAFGRWVATDANAEAFSTILAGGDSLTGASSADLLRGFGGNDYIVGSGGSDSLFGGQGDDIIYADANSTGALPSAASTYLRGEEGNDYIVGGDGFDDIQGNMGNDTEAGGMGNDWVVGGKDDDVLYGDAGADVLNGNLGNDTCDGGFGADIVRGGQGDDVVMGAAGADWLSGDLGADTLTGGSGADTFHSSAAAGIDRILDFSLAEGDRILLDPGTTYTVSQVGADTVIDMGAGNQVILAGVQLSSLSGGWLTVG